MAPGGVAGQVNEQRVVSLRRLAIGSGRHVLLDRPPASGSPGGPGRGEAGAVTGTCPGGGVTCRSRAG